MKSYTAGARSVMPLVPGVIPFALIYSITAAGIGLDFFHSQAMSIIVFAGAAQLAILDLLGNGAEYWVAVMAAVVINLRMMMYSASLVHYQERGGFFSRLFRSYLITDQAFAVSVTQYEGKDNHDRIKFFIGAGFAMWSTWQIGCMTGFLLGKSIPKEWGLDFGIPLTFMALLVPVVKTKPHFVSAVVGGAFSLMLHSLPYSLGLPVAGILGITAGVIAEAKYGK